MKRKVEDLVVDPSSDAKEAERSPAKLAASLVVPKRKRRGHFSQCRECSGGVDQSNCALCREVCAANDG